MIDLNNVSFAYTNGNPALHNITLHIDKGEFVFVVGHSGAGKSSLLKLLTRENVATSGTVIVNGYNLSRLRKNQVPYFRRSLGMVFQDFRLIPNMNVFDNVAFVLRVTNHSNKFIRNRVPYVLNLVDLGDKAKSLPNQLSGGEQQRVAIARALATDPPFIIADEPTGNIDPGLSLQIVELLKDINKYCGTTIMMVTHEHELVRHIGGRVVSIENGAIAFDEVIGGFDEGQ
ncbi:MAG: cell division ATP-binding protein FtsE [Massilioclostridium sp.]|jgi:cell division transport system ATP-binding protein|nr:cell division ATP-binding protein FtsE [Massilioclostridium sp.]MEE1491734.1 cell division ATP-binding protein FtsE [Massilioclostridium sp.]